jgi:FkbM family methyltransferase
MKLVKTFYNFFLYFSSFGFSDAIRVILKTRLIQRNDIKLELSNVQHPFYLRKNKSDIETFNQIFLYKEYEITLGSEPKNVIDAGANIGLAAIFFNSKYPKAKIVSIEPEKNNFELLKKNTNSYLNITCLNYALSNTTDEEISVVDKGFGDWGFLTEKQQDNNSINVRNKIKTISINDIVKTNNWTEIDLIKIDIEGYEKEVFQSNFEWLKITKVLIIELHDRMVSGSSRPFFRAIGQFNFNYEHKGENLIFTNKDF